MNIGIGDKVRAVFYSEREVTGTITKIVPRYIRKRGKLINPLLDVKTDANIETFDSSYVVEIIEHSKIRPGVYNAYRHSYKPEPRRSFKTKKKGILYGPLKLLAELMLAKSNKFVPTEIDGNKLHELYNKNPVGMIKRDRQYSSYDSDFYFYKVRERRFRKWVEANVTRILCTVEEQTKFDTKLNNDFEDEVMHDIYAQDEIDYYVNLPDEEDTDYIDLPDEED